MNKPEMHTYRFRVMTATGETTESIAVPLGNVSQAWRKLLDRLVTARQINDVVSITRLN